MNTNIIAIKYMMFLKKLLNRNLNLAEKATYKVDRYCRKLADYYNAYYKNEASCPSI